MQINLTAEQHDTILNVLKREAEALEEAKYTDEQGKHYTERVKQALEVIKQEDF